MVKSLFNTPKTSWKPVLDKRAADAAKNAKTSDLEYSEYEALKRLNKLFEQSLTASLIGDSKLCSRATENGPCGHFKIKADQYCEFHKNPALFAATGYTDQSFYRHASLEGEVKIRFSALKPSV